MISAQREAVHVLWDELADFPVSQADAALNHLMNRLGSWFKADNMVWIGTARLGQGTAARRDSLFGWRVLAVRHWHPTPRILDISRLALDTQESDPGMTTCALAASAGRWRIHRLHDGFVDIKAFRQTPHYRAIYTSVGITDRMFVGIPVNGDTESFFLVDRKGKTARFNAAETALVGYVMRGLKWFHRELLLSHGLLLAGTPLSPTERRIVHLLLTERSEKEIAAELGQSPKTTHKYITEILRKYGVKGRVGLMALWLNRGG